MIHSLKKILLLVLFISLLFLTNFSKSNAQSTEFNHVITASYNILQNRSAEVSYFIKTTNRVNGNYLKKFTLRLPFEPINITSKDSSTPIKVKNLKKASNINIYELEIEFTSPVLGKDKTFDWNISFKIENLLLPHGIQNAAVLPTFSNDMSISSYNINISVPKLFGDIKYIYGKAGVVDTGSNYFINFVATRNQTSSVLILLGPPQQYELEISSQEENTNLVSLPALTRYQMTYYSEFPKRKTNISNLRSENVFDLKKGEVIKGIINTDISPDSSKGNSKLFTTDSEIFKRKLEGLDLEGLTAKEKAEKIYLDLISGYSVNQYKLTDSIKSELTDDKISLNIEELNLVYKQFLGLIGIESRGVYGYVFPIQPFERDKYFVEQHVWTEFWDGSTWVSVDPTWLISSRGTSYFGNNRFHHIKFGEYFDIEELNTFFNTQRFLKMNPLSQTVDIPSQGELNINTSDTVYLNKELKIEYINNLNYPIRLNLIKYNNSDESIRMDQNEQTFNVIIFPNEEVSSTTQLNYDFILLNRNYSADLNLEYDNGKESKIIRTSNIQTIIQSNISNYITYLVIGIFILIGGFSLIGMSFYKHKKLI